MSKLDHLYKSFMDVYRQTAYLMPATTITAAMTPAYQPSQACQFMLEKKSGATTSTVTVYGLVAGSSGNEAFSLPAHGVHLGSTTFTSITDITVSGDISGTLSIRETRGGQPLQATLKSIATAVPCAFSASGGGITLDIVNQDVSSNKESVFSDFECQVRDMVVIKLNIAADGQTYTVTDRKPRVEKDTGILEFWTYTVQEVV